MIALVGAFSAQQRCRYFCTLLDRDFLPTMQCGESSALLGRPFETRRTLTAVREVRQIRTLLP